MAEQKHKVVGLADLLKGVTCSTEDVVKLELQHRAHLLVEVRDERSSAPFAGTRYEASGPHGEQHAGTTDDRGRFAHRDVPAGDYTVKLLDLDELELIVPTTIDPTHFHCTLAHGRAELDNDA